MRTYRKATQPGFKVCNRCDRELEATPEVFLRDRSRADGLAYECRECHRARKLGRDDRTDRWADMTPEQKKTTKARHLRYGRTDKGRAVSLRNRYRQIDSCDLSTAEVLSLIRQPCVHCGTTEYPRGLDRIDNGLPHIRGNVAPACFACNHARGDRFTFEEFGRIAAVIREVLRDRTSMATASEVHL